MDKLEMILNESEDIIDIVGTISNEGEYRSCCRILDFTILKDKIVIKIGDIVTFKVNSKIQFKGIITSKSISTDDQMLNISCKDFGIYLKKNYGTYKFKNINPRSITEKICKDFNIPYSKIFDLNTLITRNFINENLYNIIMTCYTLNSEKKFAIESVAGELQVVERGSLVEKYILEDNLISVDATESIDNMINTVNIYNHEDKLIKTIQNENDRKIYGQFNDYLKLYKDYEKDYTKEANKKLKSVEQKISVGCLGNYEFVTNKAIIVETPINNIKGKYYIDADTHKWQNGIYTNKLTLNFEAIMDEHEVGGLEKSIEYKKTVSKKTGKKSTKKATDDYSIYLSRL